jgi:hypothetical protein
MTRIAWTRLIDTANMTLSQSDARVLQLVFDPESNDPSSIVSSSNTFTIHNKDEEKLGTSSASLEIASIRAAEKGELEEARQLINKAIHEEPTRASLYNNRWVTIFKCPSAPHRIDSFLSFPTEHKSQD